MEDIGVSGMLSGLAQVFEEFKIRRKRLNDLVIDTEEAYTDLQTAINLDTLKTKLNFDNDKKEICRCFSDPAIIFIGQTKAGKSSVINEILGKTIVTVDQTPCTSRLVTLEYAEVEKPRVIVKTRNGKVLKDELMAKNYIPSNIINLPLNERDKEKAVNATVLVKLNNSLLKTGLKVTDSPGRNENPALNDLVFNQLDSALPLIVYVIDGRQLATEDDIADIKTIKSKLSTDSLFFVLTKMDPGQEEQEEWEYLNLNDQEKEEEAQKLRDKLMDTVYSRLIKEKILPKKPIKECDKFHAISSWKVKEYRRKFEKNPDIKKDFYVRDFERFLNCLQNYTKEQLTNVSIGAVERLKLSHSKCLDIFISTATTIRKEETQTNDLLRLIKQQEEKLFDTVIDDLEAKKADLVVDMKNMLKENSKRISENAASYRYANLPFDVPEDGYVKETDMIEKCREQVEQFVYTEVSIQIHKIISERITGGNNLIEELINKTEVLEKECPVGVATTLRKMIVSQYKCSLEPRYLKQTIVQKVIRGFKSIVRSIKLGSVFTGRVRVGHSKWKESESEDILENMNGERIGDCLIQDLKEHFMETHLNFTKQFEELSELRKNGIEMSGVQRKSICDKAPTIARLELRTADLMDSDRFKHLDLREELGKGAQGSVHRCVDLKTNKEYASKVVRVNGMAELGELAMEIHYTRQFWHKRILPLLGTMIKPDSNNKWKISLIYPLMQNNLQDKLPQMLGLRKRLEIAYQTAEGLLYLHKEGLIHRDIKASNILLDDNDNAVIADFGLMKAYGLINNSLVGTPIHIADEIIKKDRDYDTSVDVYSFGVLLWYICEGSGNHPTYAQFMPGVGAILVAAALGTRPEKKPFFRSDCWTLMENCWHQEPKNRPTMLEVMKDLEKILKKPGL